MYITSDVDLSHFYVSTWINDQIYVTRRSVEDAKEAWRAIRTNARRGVNEKIE